MDTKSLENTELLLTVPEFLLRKSIPPQTVFLVQSMGLHPACPGLGLTVLFFSSSLSFRESHRFFLQNVSEMAYFSPPQWLPPWAKAPHTISHLDHRSGLLTSAAPHSVFSRATRMVLGDGVSQTMALLLQPLTFLRIPDVPLHPHACACAQPFLLPEGSWPGLCCACPLNFFRFLFKCLFDELRLT